MNITNKNTIPKNANNKLMPLNEKKQFNYLQIANNIMPAYRSVLSFANPTKMKAGTIMYRPKTAAGLTQCCGNRLTTEP